MKCRMAMLSMLAAAVATGALMGCDNEPSFVPAAAPTNTGAPTRTVTPTATASPTITPTVGTGANIGFFGVLRADDTVLDPSGFDSAGRPIFTRATGSGFVIVVDAKPGTNDAPVGTSTYNYDPEDPSMRPDLQIEVDRGIGDDPTTAVCDNEGDNFAGVPGVPNAPDFSVTQSISNALNDLGCRFVDGAGQPTGRVPIDACVLPPDGERRPVDPATTIEFCGTVTRPLRFPNGDTVVTARVRDESGQVGPQRQLVIRVGSS